MPTPGRDPVKAMERLVRILAVLDNAGVVGSTAQELIDVADYGGENKTDLLGVDLKNLKKQGWQIDTVSGTGLSGRYRLVPGDNRLRVKLTDRQLAALQRAVILAKRSDLAKRLGVKPDSIPEAIGVNVIPREESKELSLCHQSVHLASRLHFTYKGTPRVVHPGAVRFQNYQWYLSGFEDGSDILKHFIVADMTHVHLDKPGTAGAVPEVRRIPLHPLLWAVDEPTPVTVRTRPEYVPDVVRWLMQPESQREHDGVVDLRYTVTHRAAFRSRIYVLGTRVTIPDGGAVYDDLVSTLREMAGLE